MVKAVIFDCFGVLTTDGWKQIREEFFVNDTVIAQHFIDIDKAVNAGLMDYEDFISEITKITGLSMSEIRARLNNRSPNVQLFKYIKDELKPHYKIGLLSNAAGNWLNELFEPWQVELFDATVLSYEAGTVKPDPVIYQMILSRLYVLPEEVVFIDDSERYCVAAESLGIQAVYHKDTHETIARLKGLLHA